VKERSTFISELTKSVAVPVSPNINITQLTKGDSSPLYMTLPIAEVGKRSKNGLLYDESLVSEIESQIKAGGKTGIFGHIPDGEEAHAFPLPDVYWVGAQRIGKQLYAKGYLATQRAREFYERAGAVLQKAATSIYGLGKRKNNSDGTHTLSEFNLQSLDFAPHDRAALPLSGEFALTAEMLDFGAVVATIRVPLDRNSDSAAVMSSMHKSLNGLAGTLGSATINVGLEEYHSPDEAAATAEIARLKGELTAAQQQIRELTAPVQLPLVTRQLATDFDDYNRTKIIREYNATNNPQQMIADYPMLYLDAKMLVSMNKQLIAELAKPRSTSTPTSTTPAAPQWNREYAMSETGIRELRQKFGLSTPTDEEIAAARRRTGI